MSNAFVVCCSWYTTMLGMKSSLATILSFLTENGVGLLVLFRNCACIIYRSITFHFVNDDNDCAVAVVVVDDDDDCCFPEFSY